jgi:hypothetical protein
VASTAQAVRRVLGDLLREREFTKLKVNYGVTVYANEKVSPRQYIAFERMRGGLLRPFLSNDMLPGISPPQITGDQPIEAEAPWLNADDDRMLDVALADAGSMLRTVGFEWLNAPYSKSPTTWRSQHGLLTRDSRTVSVFISPLPTLDPKAISSVRNAIPPLESRSLIEIREMLQGKNEFFVEKMQLAEALVVQQMAAARGIQVELRDCTICR